MFVAAAAAAELVDVASAKAVEALAGLLMAVAIDVTAVALTPWAVAVVVAAAAPPTSVL